jgi:predicted acyltransferase
MGPEDQGLVNEGQPGKLRVTSMPTEAKNGGGAEPSAGRLMSLDALRGFTMFWIIGGDSIGHVLGQTRLTGISGKVFEQLDHVPWEGFRFYDLIFPMFVFIVGVSLVFSLTRVQAQGGRAAAARRILRRTVVLYLLGIWYYGGWGEGWDQVRLLGVLQRIALCYGATALLFLYFRPRGLAIWCAGILLGYWALLALVPVPGVGAGHYGEGQNLANWVDATFLPLRKWDGDHDPEGLLSTLPAIGTCLLGVFAGLLLRDGRWTPREKVSWLTVGGIGGLFVGMVWGMEFPIIKKLWTSSYVLVAGGCSAMFLALFYWLIDLRGWRTWAQPMVWIGLNPIAIYLLSNVIEFDELSARVLGGPVQEFLDQRVAAGLGAVLISIGGMLLAVGVCWFLHRRKVYLRL